MLNSRELTVPYRVKQMKELWNYLLCFLFSIHLPVSFFFDFTKSIIDIELELELGKNTEITMNDIIDRGKAEDSISTTGTIQLKWHSYNFIFDSSIRSIYGKLSTIWETIRDSLWLNQFGITFFFSIQRDALLQAHTFFCGRYAIVRSQMAKSIENWFSMLRIFDDMVELAKHIYQIHIYIVYI